MKKIAISLGIIGVVAAIVVGGTIAYFSDTETSTGNTFTAGSIDLGIDNTSYYNGKESPTTTWSLSYDLDDQQGPGPDGAYLFFNFSDLKPGDWGEDTVSLHVDSNNAWACVYMELTANDDVSSKEPELDAGDEVEDSADDLDGELAQELNFFFWIDDGDNVFEYEEKPLMYGPAIDVLGGRSYAIADSEESIVGYDPTTNDGLPLEGSKTYYSSYSRG
jgi:predicted ribosomally synthesized peptide with SipW-like signal peptide